MSAEVTTGALGGAAQGAAAGASVAGAPGAVVGGIIGAVGGIFGGRKQRKARKYKKELDNLARFVRRKELLQQIQMSQSQASNDLVGSGAGTERSSGGFGVLGSIRSQGASLIKQANFTQKRTSKIANLERQANIIFNTIDVGASLANTYGEYKYKTQDTGASTDKAKI